MSISSLLLTARDALNAHQLAIDIVGSNVANVNTTGYTRQLPVFKSVGAVDVKAGSAQLGVSIDRIMQVYDSYVDAQVIAQKTNNGYSESMLQGLKNIEVIIDDTNGGGLSDALSAFWSAWEDLSQNPGGSIERSALYSASDNLVNTISYYQQNLNKLNDEFENGVTEVVSQINDKITEIADLNTRLVKAGEDTGDNNDLLDKRNEALKELSSLVEINTIENGDGTINVYLSNGHPLVQSNISHTLTVQVTNEGEMNILYTDNATNHAPTDQPLNNAITKGQLGAFLELQSETIPEYLQYINDFTQTLADNVNAVHAAGYDAYQNTGTAFFEISDPNNAAGSIRISSAITADMNRIAASASVTDDGENAAKIASLQNEMLMEGNTSTFSGFLSSIVGRIGHEVSTAQTYDDNQSMILSHLENQRESVSGVSIDEEMIALIRYQMGYTAAAKLCATANELLDELMQLVR